mmetsp:Transcript_39884/g.77543  ORF Transcript_39884/g.77543 Transcript_39884/m.77543 type:complete len:84 (+) Transcript_39884:2181-2432(+)
MTTRRTPRKSPMKKKPPTSNNLVLRIPVLAYCERALVPGNKQQQQKKKKKKKKKKEKKRATRLPQQTKGPIHVIYAWIHEFYL